MNNKPTILVLDNRFISKLRFKLIVKLKEDKNKIIDFVCHSGYGETKSLTLQSGKTILLLNNN